MLLFGKNIDISFNETFNCPQQWNNSKFKSLIMIKWEIVLNKLPFIFS